MAEGRLVPPGGCLPESLDSQVLIFDFQILLFLFFVVVVDVGKCGSGI